MKLNQDDNVGDTEIKEHRFYKPDHDMINLTDIMLVIVVFVISKYPSPLIGFNISTFLSKTKYECLLSSFELKRYSSRILFLKICND